MSSAPRVAIIGGGIGAFSTALACHRAGFKPCVFAKSDKILERSAGTGLALWYSATHCLQRLLSFKQYEQLLDISSEITTGGMRSWKGDTITPFDFSFYKKKVGTNLPPVGLALQRGEFLQLLSECVPQECVNFGEQFVSYEQGEKSILVKFASGKEVEADLLVAADGIQSPVRAQAFPNVTVRYSGFTSWRAICQYPINEQLPAGYAGESWGAAKRVGIIRLDEENVYWYLVAEAQGNQADPLYVDELKANLLALYGHFHEPISDLIKSADRQEIYRDDVMYLEPLKQYSSGRVAIVGDCAHGVSPNLGWSNCISVEDGAQLAQSLYVNSGDVLKSLVHYDEIRVPRNAAVQNATNQFAEMGQMDRMTSIRDKLLRLLPESMKRSPFELLKDYEVKIDFIKE